MGSNEIVNEYVNPFRSSDKKRWGGGVLTLFVRGQTCVLQYREREPFIKIFMSAALLFPTQIQRP